MTDITNLNDRLYSNIPLYKRLSRDFSTSLDNFEKLFLGKSYSAFHPDISLSETDKNYELKAELPGVEKNNIKLELFDNTLTLTGSKAKEKKEEGKHYYYCERSYGEFRREIALPKPVEKDNIIADFKDGILHVVLPKSVGKSGCTDITIK